MKVSVIIPTLNAEDNLSNILSKIPDDYEVIIIDSSSSDRTIEIARSYNCYIKKIERNEFNHGGTRNIGAKMASGEILIFLTQDAIPKDKMAFNKITSPFIEYSDVGMAYGRQLPHKNAKRIGSFARLHNYPNKSMIKSKEDRKKLGIKTVFCSNSFAAYRKDILNKMGGFPLNVILSEDTYVCAKMLIEGYRVAYVAEAQVYHSHDYSIIQEFKRYFDIGVFYGREDWILKEFSQAEKEGIKFVITQIAYFIKKGAPHLIFEIVIRNFMKYLGYKMGMNEKKIPVSFKKKISMTKGYWV